MNTPLSLEVHRERWDLSQPLAIARAVFTHIGTICVHLRDAEGRVGRGEAAGVSYDDETVDSMCRQIDSLRPHLRGDDTAAEVIGRLPPGGARNALDCALWDLRCRQTGLRAWQLAGVDHVRPVTTAYTIGLGSEEQVRRTMRSARAYPVLKLKVDAQQHLEMVSWARQEHPRARLLIDANQSWTLEQLRTLLPELQAAGVELIEQPLPRGDDALLEGLQSPIALAADESCTDTASLERLVGRYQVVNIKLDKSGGLTEALDVARCANALGMELMVGNMGGTSLAMAPGFLLAQQCRFVDLDAPLLLAQDRENGLAYEIAQVHAPDRSLWG